MKRILSLSLVLMMVLSLSAFAPLTVSAATISGSTDANNPTIVTQELLTSYIDKDLTGYFQIADDVEVLTITGSINSISGTFDGNGKTIDLNNTAGGLFKNAGAAGTKTVIKNLTLTGTVSFSATYQTKGGALINIADKGEIEINDVTNKADVTVQNNYAGGIVGYANVECTVLKITDCINEGDITSTVNYAGGIVGTLAQNMPSLEVIGCKNYGDITAPSYLAGIVGYCRNANVKIEKCGNEGTITGDSIAGIIFDRSDSGKNIKIDVLKSYNAGTINGTGATHSYGLARCYTAGYLTVKDCFNVGKVISTHTSGKGYLFANATIENVYNISSSRGNYGSCTINNNSLWDATNEEALNELKGYAEKLGPNFVAATLSRENAYPYPQIKDNTYVLPAAAMPESSEITGAAFPGEGEIRGTFAGQKEGEVFSYDGKYFAAYGIAPEKYGWTKTYGMILKNNETDKEYTAEAVPGSAKDENGCYGVLFYGPELVPGTYTVKPYVTYKGDGFNDTETVYGEEVEKTVE